MFRRVALCLFTGLCYLFLLGEDLLMAGTNRIQLGSAVVTRVVEWQFELRSSLFDQTPASGWQDNADLLVPTFFNPDTDRWRVAIQSWVIEVDGLTVVVDTGAGNGRQRPHMPPLDHLDTGFLDDVRAAGFDYNDVDVVINTHIHSDHLGWNTKLENGTWVPTFPNPLPDVCTRIPIFPSRRTRGEVGAAHRA